MKRILLANIGNRNIKHNGLTYIDMPKEFKTGVSFREITRQWRNNYAIEAPSLTLNILNDLIDPYQTQIEQIVLFSSNQINEEKQDQDTLYEGEIMKWLIEAAYNIPVRLDEVKCRVVDNDALLQFYRDRLRLYKKMYPDQTFVICDAGGTAQQKSSLKIMAEYILRAGQYEVHYVNPNGKLELVPQREYRRVIDNEQARSLILAGQYRAALTLRGITRLNDVLHSSDLTNELILFAYARFNRLDDLVRKVSAKLGKKISKYPDLLAVNQQESTIGEGCFTEVMSEKQRFIVGELLLKTRYLFNQQRYNEAILSLAVMYETYLTSVISHALGYNLIDDYVDEKERLKSDWAKLMPGASLTRDLDVPAQIDLCLQVNDTYNQQFLVLLKPRIGRGLGTSIGGIAINSVRNKVAHNGLYITDEYLKSNLAYLPEFLTALYHLFELPIEDPFEQFNQQITAML